MPAYLNGDRGPITVQLAEIMAIIRGVKWSACSLVCCNLQVFAMHRFSHTDVIDTGVQLVLHVDTLPSMTTLVHDEFQFLTFVFFVFTLRPSSLLVENHLPQRVKDFIMTYWLDASWSPCVTRSQPKTVLRSVEFRFFRGWACKIFNNALMNQWLREVKTCVWVSCTTF